MVEAPTSLKATVVTGIARGAQDLSDSWSTTPVESAGMACGAEALHIASLRANLGRVLSQPRPLLL